MRMKFEEQLQQLNNDILLMGDMVHKAMTNTFDAFFSFDIEKLRQVFIDRNRIDRKQKEIESICFQLMIREQPVAGDFRAIATAMKLVTDLERIGDQTAEISDLALEIKSQDCHIQMEYLRKMADETVLMLQQSMNAYSGQRLDTARWVRLQNSVVGDYFHKVKYDLIEIMRNNDECSEYVADLLMVDKHIERIGALIADVAESIVSFIDAHTDSAGRPYAC